MIGFMTELYKIDSDETIMTPVWFVYCSLTRSTDTSLNCQPKMNRLCEFLELPSRPLTARLAIPLTQNCLDSDRGHFLNCLGNLPCPFAFLMATSSPARHKNISAAQPPFLVPQFKTGIKRFPSPRPGVVNDIKTAADTPSYPHTRTQEITTWRWYAGRKSNTCKDTNIPQDSNLISDWAANAVN